MLLAHILKRQVEAAANVVVDHRGDSDAARWRKALNPRCNIDAVAIDIATLRNNVAKMDADAEFDLAVLRRSAFRAVTAFWTATAQATAFTTLGNSTRKPSPWS